MSCKFPNSDYIVGGLCRGESRSVELTRFTFGEAPAKPRARSDIFYDLPDFE